MSKYVKYIKPVEARSARGFVARVYAQMKSDLGVVPEPFTLHSPAPEILAGVWSIFRESLLTGHVRRGIKEAVAAAVSDSNHCPWCVDAHSISLYATGESEAVQAIMRHNLEHLADAEMQALMKWASSTHMPDAPIITNPPFSPQDAPEIIGTAVTFHYLNRMVNAVLSETFLPKNAWVKQLVKRSFGWLYSSSVHKIYQPGTSLEFLSEAELPDDLTWAETAPNVAGAFARFAAVVEQTGMKVISPEVRAVVHNYVGSWNGEDPGLSRQWVEQAVDWLDAEDRATCRLLLLAALAPHQVDERIINTFRAYRPGDADLIAALSWASFRTARRVGVWLSAPVTVK